MVERNCILQTEKLDIGYKTDQTIKLLGKSFNLQLHQGKFIALLGPNGSGKSTLIKTLSGLLAPLAGNVYIDGAELQTISSNQRAQKIGVVLTDPIVTAGLSVFDVVSLGRFPYTNWLGKLNATDLQIVEESLESVDMKDFTHRKMNTLSDGEKQRVMIAKALAQQSEVVILDEPTAHLDLINRVEIMKLLRTLAHKQNRAILISTHELDLAMQSADELWLMRDHEGISVGAPEDLILNKSMQEVFAQSSVDFDHLTGMFKIKHDEIINIHFEANEGPNRLWTIKAMEKLGVSLISNPKLDIKLQFQEDKKVWTIYLQENSDEFDNLGDLVDFVRLNLL